MQDDEAEIGDSEPAGSPSEALEGKRKLDSQQKNSDSDSDSNS
jgi:hypothetical protein